MSDAPGSWAPRPLRLQAADGAALAGWQNGERGPLVVMLHGSLRSSFVWRPVVRAFTCQARCIALDLPDHGDSDPVPLQVPYVNSYADRLGAAIETLPFGPLCLVGHSLGARLAIALLSRLASSRFAGLVLVEPTLAGGPTPGALKAAMPHEPVPRFDSIEDFVGFSLLLDPLADYEIMREYAESALRACPDGKLELKIAPTAYLALTENGEATRALKGLPCPLLVVRGQVSSYLTAGDAASLATSAPDGRLVTMRRCGHDIPAQQPLQLAAELCEFLGSIVPAMAGIGSPPDVQVSSFRGQNAE